MDDGKPNIFQMFVANDCKLGFWIQRTTWGNSCARVTEVGPFNGPPPYYGSPKVFADIFDLKTGTLRESRAPIPVPGTYKTWRRIAAPSWAEDLPAIRSTPRPPQAGEPLAPPARRIYFQVHYERRHEVKELGARWDPGKKAWWFAEGQTRSIAIARAAGFTEASS